MTYKYNLINKYKVLPVEVKASLWFTFCSLLQKGMSFLTVPIFTRIMTTEEYGYVTLYQSWLGIFTIICTLNITYGGFYNGMIKYKDDKDGYTSSIVFLTSLMTVGWFVIYFIFRNFFETVLNMPEILVCIMFFEIFIKAIYDTWITRQKYEYNYRRQTVVTVVCSVLTPILGVILVQNTQNKVLGRIVSFVLVYAVVCFILYGNIIKKGHKIVNYEYWKFSIQFCVPLIPHFLAQTILSQSDRIMINNMIGTSEAAIYGFSYNIAMVLTIVYQAANSSFIPWLYKRMDENDYIKIDKITQKILILIAVLTGVTMLISPEAVWILGGKKYYEAIFIIPPIIISVYFMFLYSVFFNIEVYFGKNIFAAFASVIAATFNVILNYILIPLYGYMAAGYTTVACYIMLCFLHYLCMKKICDAKGIQQNLFNVNFILIISALLMFLSGISIVLYLHIIIRYILIIFVIILLIGVRKQILLIFNSIGNRKR